MSHLKESFIENNQRTLPLGIFGCFDYNDYKGESTFFPWFCPLAMCCTNALVGRIYTKLEDENEICCEMGPKGLCLCVSLIPLGAYAPFGGFGLFCCLGTCMRSRFLKKYGVAEDTMCCLGEHMPCGLRIVFLSICYPCNFFQILMAARYFDELDRISQPSSHSAPFVAYTGALPIATLINKQ